MKIKQIFVEESVKENKYTSNILDHYSHLTPIYIDKLENYFGRVKKPYLQKLMLKKKKNLNSKN